MRADYDREANAISIALADEPTAQRADRVHSRLVVALHDDRPIELQLLYPDLGIEEPLEAAARAYGLDLEALLAGVRAALSAPDRSVTLDVDVRAGSLTSLWPRCG